MNIASVYLLQASDNTVDYICTYIEGGYDGYSLGEKKWRRIHLKDYVNISPFTNHCFENRNVTFSRLVSIEAAKAGIRVRAGVKRGINDGATGRWLDQS